MFLERGAPRVLASKKFFFEFRNDGIKMEVNQHKRQLKDLGERIHSLRGFL